MFSTWNLCSIQGSSYSNLMIKIKMVNLKNLVANTAKFLMYLIIFGELCIKGLKTNHTLTLSCLVTGAGARGGRGGGLSSGLAFAGFDGISDSLNGRGGTRGGTLPFCGGALSTRFNVLSCSGPFSRLAYEKNENLT